MRTRRYRKDKVKYDMSPLPQELLKWGTNIYKEEEEKGSRERRRWKRGKSRSRRRKRRKRGGRGG